MAQKKIDLRELSDDELMSLAREADLLRQHRQQKADGQTQVTDYPSWDLGVVGRLSREEIYDDD